MIRALTTLRTLGIALSLGAGFAAASCGGDSKEEPPPAPKDDGGKPPLEPIMCAEETCEGVPINIAGYESLQPCCAEGDQCGLDSSFLSAFGVMFSETCQAKDQPGVEGQGCPDSAPPSFPGVELPPFKGCCRVATHTCGYVFNEVLMGLIKPKLGCVDSTPFLEGGTAMDCDPGEGAGGAGP
jgi:hypothetical protein